MQENRYYVYGHYFKGTNDIFYVGKGTGSRDKAVSSRSKKWKEVTANNDWYSVILFSSLSFIEALCKEDSLIKMLKDKIINVNSSTNKILNISDINKFLYYDEGSTTCLSWLIWNRANNPIHSRRKGEVAGGLKIKNDKKVSSALMLNGMSLQISRVIWYLVNGEYPSRDYVIDHIDGNPWNNKISNLRKVTYEINAKNKTLQDNNTTGVAGIHKMFNGYSSYYNATITSKTKRKCKSFNIDKIGEEKAFKLACEWRKAQIKLLNDQGAGYTDRHGT